MSAYAEWKNGLITDAEYASICRQEYYEEKSHWSKGHDWDEEEEYKDDDIDEW